MFFSILFLICILDISSSTHLDFGSFSRHLLDFGKLNLKEDAKKDAVCPELMQQAASTSREAPFWKFNYELNLTESNT